MKSKKYLKAKEYLDKAIELLKNGEATDAIELLKNGEFEQAEGFVQKTIGLIGTHFTLLKAVGEINVKDKEKVRSALENLGFILLRNNAYHATMQSFWISDILLRQIVEKKSFKHVTEKYSNYLFNTNFFMDFAMGMHNWVTNNFEAAQGNFKSAIFRVHDKRPELIRYLENILLLIDADSKFMSLFEIDDPTRFYETLSEIDYWERKKNINDIYEVNDPIVHSLPEVRDVIAGRGFCLIVYTHFLQTIFDLLKQLENTEIDNSLIEKIREKFNQIKARNEVVKICEKFLFACISALVTYKKLESIPKHRYGRLMNLLHPIWPTYTKWMNSLIIKKTRENFFEKNLLQLNNQIDPVVFLVYEEGISPKYRERKAGYARIWTNQTKPEGDVMDEQKFNEIVKNKGIFKIFVIDRGEEKIGSVGEVYLNNEPVFPQPEKDKVVGSKKDKKKEIKKYLTPIEYSLLVHALKNQGKAGDIFALIKECWRRPDFAKVLQGDWNEIEKGRGDVNKFRRDTSGHRKTIGALSSFLNKKIGIKLRTFGKAVYRFSMQVKFGLIEVS